MLHASTTLLFLVATQAYASARQLVSPDSLEDGGTFRAPLPVPYQTTSVGWTTYIRARDEVAYATLAPPVVPNALEQRDISKYRFPDHAASTPSGELRVSGDVGDGDGEAEDGDPYSWDEQSEEMDEESDEDEEQAHEYRNRREMEKRQRGGVHKAIPPHFGGTGATHFNGHFPRPHHPPGGTAKSGLSGIWGAMHHIGHGGVKHAGGVQRRRFVA